MRDQLDTKTSDLLPGKLGRPCANPDRGPMTDAERARAYRNRVRSRAGLARAQADRDVRRKVRTELTFLGDYSDAQLLEAIRLTLAEVRDIGNKGSKARAAHLVAELARRYPS
ncbi:hypothetical protein [Luteimonas fraxinea]|uniref:Uncharacterized protein n=1 Tax=Luteimonas fraxinea TaxID=2901869 RepID=A0ABS8UBU4_9GAMM|nr:hypothetical protein [Luteimonas fraxinea]MCD9096524.1 hypothetical protein [Luteimonas fraxinea]